MPHQMVPTPGLARYPDRKCRGSAVHRGCSTPNPRWDGAATGNALGKVSNTSGSISFTPKSAPLSSCCSALVDPRLGVPTRITFSGFPTPRIIEREIVICQYIGRAVAQPVARDEPAHAVCNNINAEFSIAMIFPYLIYQPIQIGGVKAVVLSPVVDKTVVAPLLIYYRRFRVQSTGIPPAPVRVDSISP